MIGTRIDDWYATPTNFTSRSGIALYVFDPIRKLAKCFGNAKIGVAGECYTHR